MAGHISNVMVSLVPLVTLVLINTLSPHTFLSAGIEYMHGYRIYYLNNMYWRLAGASFFRSDRQ